MPEMLYVQLPRSGDAASWLAVDAYGNRIGRVQHGPLGEVSAQLHGRSVVAIVPGECATLMQVNVPTRNTQKLLQALPFALEDRLAEDVDTLHFALGQRREEGSQVAVVSRADMARWQTFLATAGLSSVEIVPDISSLPVLSGIVTVVLDGTRALLRLPDGSGMAGEYPLTAYILRRYIAAQGDSSPLPKVVLHAPDEESGRAFLTTLGTVAADIVQEPLTDGLLPMLSTQVRDGGSVNLLQGEFKLHGALGEQWRHWRVPALLLAVFLALGIIEQSVSYLRLRHDAADLSNQVIQLYQQALPGARIQPGTERTRMEQRLAQLQGTGGADLLSLLDRLAAAMNATTGAQITAISYQNGALQVELQTGDAGTLDAIKSSLSQQPGLIVNLDSVSATGNQVTGRILLTGSAP